MLKRAFDLLTATVLLALSAPLLLLTAVLVKATSPGPVLHVSKRIGHNNQIFRMFKFRSMRVGTPQVATHLMKNPTTCLTPVGSILRKTSIDELPQLLNVILGNMSLVGPRPALFNQYDLIDLRTRADVHKLKPGLTGWAQTHGRDELSIPDKVKLDAYYLANQSIRLDLRILALTLLRVLRGAGVSH